jgi:hypothetical protein
VPVEVHAGIGMRESGEAEQFFHNYMENGRKVDRASEEMKLSHLKSKI